MSRLAVFLMFAGSLALLSCKKEEPLEEEVVTYELGQEHLGGIIVELDETKQHGLVVAKVDQVTYNDHINWSDSKEQVEAYTVGGPGWRLPTKEELELIHANKSTIGGFDNRNYWSSHLGSSNNAWSLYFGPPGGITTSNWKDLGNCTLCSRGVKDF